MSEYLYVFRRADGPLKLSWTINVRRRRSNLSSSTGIRHEVERTWEVPARATAIEGFAHYELKQFKLKGYSSFELYDLPLEQICDAVERAIVRIGSAE